MELLELREIVESLLFVATEPLPIERIREITGAGKREIQEALTALIDHFKSENHGIAVVEIAGGYQMVSREENGPWIKKLLAVKGSGRLSKPGLETLAIIAYKQPIIRADVEAVRGVDSGGVIRTLLERRLVRIVGRREIPGRPILYGTTREFLEYFGLKNLSELPTLKEFRETGAEDLIAEAESGAGEGMHPPETASGSPEEKETPPAILPEVEVVLHDGS